MDAKVRSNEGDYAYAYGGLHRAVEMFLAGVVTREGLVQFERGIEAELRESSCE